MPFSTRNRHWPRFDVGRDRFWLLIEELGGEITDASWHRLYRAVRRPEPEEILAFEDRFAEVLFGWIFILADHRRFRRTWSFDAERLLTVSHEAYEAASGRPWPEDHISPHNYETGSNPDGAWKRENYPPATLSSAVPRAARALPSLGGHVRHRHGASDRGHAVRLLRRLAAAT